MLEPPELSRLIRAHIFNHKRQQGLLHSLWLAPSSDKFTISAFSHNHFITGGERLRETKTVLNF